MPGLGSVSEGMMDTQLDLQKIQMGGVQIQQAQVELQKDKMQLAQQVKMLSLMQNLKPPQEVNTPDGIAGVLNQMSMIQLEAGMPDAAAKTASEASRLQENASKIDFRTYKMQNDRMSKFANILSVTPDTPQGYAAAIQAMTADDPAVAKDPKFQSIARQPWRPGWVPMLQRSVLTAKEQAEVNYRKAAEGHADAAKVVDEHRVALIDQQVKTSKARELAVKKEGGVVVKADQLKTITDMAEVDFPGADPADLRVRSRPLAEEMVKMMREQRLQQSEAGRRVYEKARSSGIFTGLRIAPVVKGAQPGAALPIPEKAKSFKDLKQNQWYLFDGVPKVVMGTKAYSEQELADIDKEDADLLNDKEDDE